MIIFDARAQQSSRLTGIGVYTRHLALNILTTHIGKKVRFFENALASAESPLPHDQTTATHIPNKLLNAAIALARRPTIQQLMRAHTDTPVFLPNINFIATSAPYALTVHDLSFKHFPSWYPPKMRLWHKTLKADEIISRAYRIICVSQATADDVCQTYNISHGRVSVIYPGVCTKNVAPHTQTRPYIIAMSSIEPRKNQTALLHAFARVIKRPRHTNLELKIIGPHIYRARTFHKLIASLGLEQHVTYEGYVEQTRKHELLAGARACVYPSLMEGFGFPPLEAMHHGTPVIASWSSSLKEVCGNNALYINPYHFDELADAIEAILDDDTLRTELNEAGKLHVKQFSWASCAQETARVLGELTC